GNLSSYRAPIMPKPWRIDAGTRPRGARCKMQRSPGDCSPILKSGGGERPLVGPLAPLTTESGRWELTRRARVLLSKEEHMGDNKQHTGQPDRGRVSGAEDYEVRDSADKHGLSIEQARELIRTHGSQREALDRAAEQLR